MTCDSTCFFSCYRNYFANQFQSDYFVSYPYQKNSIIGIPIPIDRVVTKQKQIQEFFFFSSLSPNVSIISQHLLQALKFPVCNKNFCKHWNTHLVAVALYISNVKFNSLWWYNFVQSFFFLLWVFFHCCDGRTTMLVCKLLNLMPVTMFYILSLCNQK